MTGYVRVVDRDWPPEVGTPASAQAIRHGCSCPLDANLWGKRLVEVPSFRDLGRLQDWVLHRGCPVHGAEAPPPPLQPPPPPRVPPPPPLDL